MAGMIRLVIADDEPIALKRLEIALQCVPDAEIVGKAKNGAEALTMIRSARPDIAILDVQMPGRSGLEVAAALRATDPIPEIIFVTAFEQHASQAFVVNAADYLVKPVPFDRFREALQRARERLHARTADARFAELQLRLMSLAESANKDGGPVFESELWVREREGLTRIAVEDIDLLEAAGDYVIAHLGETTHLISDSITALQAKLDPEILFRVHRGSIVNLRRVRSLRRRGRRGLALILTSGQQVAVGPSYTEDVLQAVKAKRWR